MAGMRWSLKKRLLTVFFYFHFSFIFFMDVAVSGSPQLRPVLLCTQTVYICCTELKHSTKKKTKGLGLKVPPLPHVDSHVITESMETIFLILISLLLKLYYVS